MPKTIDGKPVNEEMWSRAKKRAAEEGHAEDWEYVMSIYKKMTGLDKSQSQPRGIVTNAHDWRSHRLQGKTTYMGLPVSIENERGSLRIGVNESGEEWRTFMHMPYGYVRGSEGTDGDRVDVYIGPHQTSERVFIVHQNDPDTGEYDEDKVLLGFDNRVEARKAYERQYDRSGFFGSITEVDIDEFKAMLKENRGVKLKKSNASRVTHLEKGKRYNVGEVSTKTGLRKVAPGKWAPVADEEDLSNYRDVIDALAGVFVRQQVALTSGADPKKMLALETEFQELMTKLPMKMKTRVRDEALRVARDFMDDRLEKSNRKRVSDLNKADRRNLVQIEKPVTRRGKTFMQKFWVSPKQAQKMRQAGAKKTGKFADTSGQMLMFDPTEWAKQHDEPDITPDKVLARIAEKEPSVYEKVRDTEERLKQVKPTADLHRISGEGAGSVYTEERARYHEKIIRQIVTPEKMQSARPERGQKPTIIMLGGRGGSGKSWFRGNVYDPDKTIVLDSDWIKEQLPEYEGWNAFEVHEESGDILEKALEVARTYRLNIVIDATMKSPGSAMDQVNRFKGTGYRVEAHYLHCPRQISAERAVSRFTSRPGGRYVPVSVVLQNTTNETTFKLVSEQADNWSFRDSQGKPPPKLLAQKGQAKLMKSTEPVSVRGGGWNPHDFYDFRSPQEPSEQTRRLIETYRPLLEKARGKRDPIGTVRNGRKKVAEGKWVRVSQGREREPKYVEEDGQMRLPGMDPESAKRLLKEYAKREPGNGIEKPIEREEHLDAILRHGTICMISAGRNPEDAEDMKLTDEQIAERYETMIEDFKSRGYVVTRCEGKYVNPEESVMVMAHDADRAEMMELGEKYKQDSIVFSDKGQGELIYTTGPNKGKAEMAGDGYQVVPDADDFYTKMTFANGHTVKFTINLEEIRKALAALRDLMKAKYVRKYWKGGRWNYVYPDAGERRPTGLGDYKVKRNLGGSTGGALHVILPNGEQKVLKQSTGPDHLREEYAANRVYKALGVPVPNVKLARDKEGSLVQVADYVKGTPLGELGPSERERAIESLKDGFIADALLGNWDVLGMDEDNILWDGSKAWRVDNGGAMRYRAQGASKEFGDEVGELESMRDPSRGAGKRAYSGITHEEMADQVRKVVAKRDRILAGIHDASLRRTMENRIDSLSQVFGKSRHDISEGSLIKSNDGRWWLLEKGRLTRFFWLGPLQKSQALSKAERATKYYSPEEIKARGMRWVTIRGARVLLQGTSDGGYVVVGGAGGKLNHLKVDRIQSKEEYQARRKQIEKKGKEETRALTKEEIAEQREKRKAQVSARKKAREAYTEQITQILGITPDEIRSNIKADQMSELEARARSMVENRAAAKTMDEKALEKEVDKQTEKEVQKAVNKQVKNVERAALQALVEDYMPSDPNAKPELKQLLDDKDKALEILAARKQFRKQIKEIGKEGADTPSDLKIGSVTAADAGESIEDVKREIAEQIETQENMRLYDMVNAQSTSIKRHIDQGAASSLNGLIGDLYGTGATFSQDTIERLGIEAVARAITIKVQQDGKGEVVRRALEEYVTKERKRVVSEAIDEAEKRFGNADELRRMAQGGDDAEAILSAASANGYALKQITAAQRALGTAVGSLRAASHMINALNDPPADVVQVDMGKDLARAREHAKAAGLVKGSYSIRTKKQGRSKRLVMEIPKESLNNFFQNNIEKTERMDRISQIKQHKMNDGYIPPGVKQSIKLDSAQEAGLKFFMEQGRVLLDFEAGLGKTAVAYAAMAEAVNNRGAKKILVVTPSGTRGDFYRQRETFLEKDMQKMVRQSTANTSKSERRKRHLEQDGIHIVSQDSLREDMDVLKQAGYDMVVVDEIHEMTAGTGQAGRFKALKELDEVPMKIAMSGTNIKNSKEELYRKIDFIDPGHTLGTMAEFNRRYQGLNQGTGIFQDASNDSFRKEMGQWMYTQKNQLPVQNNENTVRVPMTPAQRKAYAASERQYREEREAGRPGASARRDSRNYAILSDGDAQANGKLDSVVNLMRDKHAGEKAVIHVSQPGKPVLEAMRTAAKRLESEFGAGSVGMIHGDTGPGELAKIKARFNDPGDPLRFIVGTKTLESGHNLQHGGTVSFHLDIPDSQAAMNQRNARVFRKGQDRDTTSYLLSGLNPMDMRGEDMLSTKKREMSILGNPREIEAMDDTGFIGMLNRYEQEVMSGTQ